MTLKYKPSVVPSESPPLKHTHRPPLRTKLASSEPEGGCNGTCTNPGLKSRSAEESVDQPPSVFERIWHIYDSQGQILAVAFWGKSGNHLSCSLYARPRHGD